MSISLYLIETIKCIFYHLELLRHFYWTRLMLMGGWGGAAASTRHCFCFFTVPQFNDERGDLLSFNMCNNQVLILLLLSHSYIQTFSGYIKMRVINNQ